MKRKMTVALVLVASIPLGLWAGDNARLEIEFRHRVFEAPQALVEKLVPAEQRSTLPAKQTSEAGAGSWLIARVTKETVQKLLQGIADKPDLLADRKRVIPESPGVADTWAYSRADRDVHGAGTGGGILGVQEQNGRLVLTMQYNVTHSINTAKPVCSEFAYGGPLPEAGTMLFLHPFAKADGTSRFLVLVFEIRVFEIRQRHP